MIMPIVKMSAKKVPSLRYLNFLALKHIFDRFHMAKQEERLLDEGIERWVKKVDLMPEEKRELRAIVDCLLHDKEGRFDKEKYAYKRAGVDYRKVYREGI